MLKSTIRGLQSLLDEERVLALAVEADGAPCAGLLPFVPVTDRSAVLVHVSRLARHSRGLGAGARVSVLVHEPDGPGKDPLQLHRATFDGEVQMLERGSEAWQAGRARYLERFPDAAVTFTLGDFALCRIELLSGVYVEGFARAIKVPREDIARLGEVV